MKNGITMWNPDDGFAVQGDLLLVPVGGDLSAAARLVKPTKGQVRLLEGELTGHHHAIDTLERPTISLEQTAAMLAGTWSRSKWKNDYTGCADLYEDTERLGELIRAGVLTEFHRSLARGFLHVHGGSVALEHPEHGAIGIPSGLYFVSRQLEFVGDVVRRVED